jgi:hypothetical protein
MTPLVAVWLDDRPAAAIVAELVEGAEHLLRSSS